MRRCLAVPVVVTLALLVGRANPAEQEVYVGTALCVRCHIDFARQWEALPHSQLLLADSLPPERRGCEACHGPGGGHATTRRASIWRWKKLDVTQRNDLCLPCHAKVTAPAWRGSKHHTAVACNQCHDVHRPTSREFMLRPAEGQDCAPCHDNLAQEVAAKRHHSLGDGALTCGLCHGVHGTANPALLLKPLAEGCPDCHGDDVPQPESHARADFKLHHKPDATGHEPECLACHDQQLFCNACHVIKLPHPEDFPVAHKEACQQHPQSCLRCHEEAQCKLCHEQIPPPVGKAATE